MLEALAAFGVISLFADVAFVWQIRQAEKRLQNTTRLFEGIVTRNAEREASEAKAHWEQVNELLTRIQAPKDAPYILNMEEGHKQHVGLDDDEGYWEAQREMNGDE